MFVLVVVVVMALFSFHCLVLGNLWEFVMNVACISGGPIAALFISNPIIEVLRCFKRVKVFHFITTKV